MRGRTLALVAMGLGASVSAHAIPPPPPEHAAYGPLTQCFAGYRIDVSDQEAVVLSEGGVYHRLLNDDYQLYMRMTAPEDTVGSRSDIEVPGLGAVTQLAIPAHSGSPALADPTPARWEYLLKAEEGDRQVTVGSSQFDGSAGDLDKLRRLARIDPARDTCGTFSFPAYAGESADALSFSPALHPGPIFHCQAGIGFAVDRRESVQNVWPDHPRAGRLTRVLAAGRAMTLSSPNNVAAGEGRLLDSGYVASGVKRPDGATALVLTPPAAGGPVDASSQATRQITIDHMPDRAIDAQALAERLEFVKADDTRCTQTDGPE